MTNKVYVPNETVDLNLSIFNMIKWIENVNEAYVMQMEM